MGREQGYSTEELMNFQAPESGRPENVADNERMRNASVMADAMLADQENISAREIEKINTILPVLRQYLSVEESKDPSVQISSAISGLGNKISLLESISKDYSLRAVQKKPNILKRFFG